MVVLTLNLPRTRLNSLNRKNTLANGVFSIGYRVRTQDSCLPCLVSTPNNDRYLNVELILHSMLCLHKERFARNILPAEPCHFKEHHFYESNNNI